MAAECSGRWMLQPNHFVRKADGVDGSCPIGVETRYTAVVMTEEGRSPASDGITTLEFRGRATGLAVGRESSEGYHSFWQTTGV